VAEQSFTPKKYQDFISEFTSGMDSGIAPLLLKKNQLAIAVNCSLRGGFLHPRAPWIKRSLNVSATLQTLLSTGLFQSAGYYRPDTGTESLLASISGHLFQFQETSYGGTWNVSDVSVPGSLNSATAAMSWMWQSEQFMVVNDGTGALPIFFSGVSSRRSYGPTVILGTVTAATPAAPPPIYVASAVPPLNSNTGNTTNVQADAAVSVTLTAPYTGPYNVPVIFNGEYYMPVQTAQGFNVLLTNITDTPGTTVASGSQVVLNPSNVAYVTQTTSALNTFQMSILTIPVSTTFGISLGDTLVITTNTYDGAIGPYPFSQSWTVTAINPAANTVTIETTGIAAGASIAQNAVVMDQSITSPSVIVGNTTSAYTVPAVDGTQQVSLTQPYAGAAGQIVTIGTAQYSISLPSASGGGATLILINLSDTATANYSFNLNINSVPELPAGRMGAYGNGRNWFSLTNGLSYEAGDIVGGGSGTPAYNYRDAVLKTTENDFLTNGGTFSLPGSGDIITAMIFPPVLDNSLGVGSLQIFTPFSVFANNAPADRTTWANLTWPIQSETLKDQGALSQDATTLVNSDVFFRGDFNIGSLVLARRQFQLNEWGNKPVSNEMQRILALDNQLLLGYSSSKSFDNRYIQTCSPTNGPQGVFHTGFVILNFDLLSSLRQSLPATWEGAWEGLNVLKILQGRVNGTRRCFAFTYNALTAQIELYELLAESVAMQQGVVADNNATPITWMFETPILFNQDIKPLTELTRLRDGEIYISNLTGSATISVYYKPDFYACWTLWNTKTVCANMTAINANPSYRMRLGLGEPDARPMEPGSNRPLRVGYFFQFRFVITGSCTFNGMRVSATSEPDPTFAPVTTNTACDAVNCNTTPDLSLYSLQNPPYEAPVAPNPTPSSPPFVCNYRNQTTIYDTSKYCSFAAHTFGIYIIHALTPPEWITLTEAEDEEGNTLVNAVTVAAGIFCGTTQASANALALAMAKNYIASELLIGNLNCSAPI
jgi:hypothetical protein